MTQKTTLEKGFDEQDWVLLFGYLIFVLFLLWVSCIGIRAIYNSAYPKEKLTPSQSLSLPSSVRQLCTGFSKTVYSNATPADSDIINLCDAGTLRPAVGNIRIGGAQRGEKPYNDSIEILMIVNLITRKLGIAGPFEVAAFTEPKSQEYLLFNAGTEHEITTSGRTFLVKLLEINREPTKDGTPYFSYHFIVNEK